MVCHAIRTQGIGLETRSLLGELTMQDRIIPCKHDFILRLGLDIWMSCISRLTDGTASNLISLAREMYATRQIGCRPCVAIGVEFSRYWT